MQTTAVSSSPYTVVSGHTYLAASNSLAITFQLPTPIVNTWFFVVDSGGSSLTNNITIKRAGSEKINGVQGDLILNTNYGSCGLISNGTDWFVLTGNFIVDDTDGHIYRIGTVGGIVTSQLVV